MSLAPDVTSARTEDTFVLPHQPVICPESITTKLRVVFDASAKTSLGTSLNDKLLIGPNLQKDLFEIILRFGSHKVVLTADITAMFRQIRVREEDRGLQTILWRSDVSQPIQTYQLNTVTYGTAPAPFLAMRCLRQLAAEDSKYPQAAKMIEEDFYMDDVLTDSLLKLDKEGALKTLGLLWDAKTDIMQYSVTIDESTKISKRLVLPKIAQIFDPLGLLGSTLINAKCIMQQIWQLQTGWDENLPPQLQNTWDEYYNSLPKINEIRIPRNINPGNDSGKFDLIGFGDASEKAYGACLYAVSRNSKGETNSHLICSKGRVAPLKTISLPKLELNAALVLAKLCHAATQAFSQKIQGIYLWSDSTVTLTWIASSPNLRKIYVANRVTKIQNLTRNAVWLHVPSEHNPADLISRGMTFEDWETRDLWWHGPPWLKTGEWPEQKTINIDTSEMKPSVVLISSKSTSDVLRKFSTYGKLERVLAYCIRFRFNALGPKQSGSLTVEELEGAEKAIVKMTQRESFFPEYNALKQGEQVPKGSKLAVLSPFLDKRELFEWEADCQALTFPKHKNIRLFYQIVITYWALSGRREARKVTSNCIQCYRSRPKVPDVMMGDLPTERVRGSLKPFTNAGVDYAGPLQVRESRRRGRVPTTKAWIVVFTCLATRTVHLELVTEMTTEAFLSTLRRFVVRREICSTMISDNGTNFVGAARELKELYAFLESEKQTISDHLAQQRLVFTFEEYYTLLVELESILNSRPLTPLSSNPNDTTALSPSHFLVGNSLLLPTEHNYLKVPDNRLSRWQHLQKVRQHFWNRWYQEYLSELQKRQKWHFNHSNVNVGTLVLLKEENLPPLQWLLGRVVEVHVGADNIVRVATVRTSTGLFKRAVKKLCPLPVEEEDKF
ncbi:uncharacterized protein LOC124179783 [Neodiprion fabricii]|uniref:uncharacterized protein LOC124179783 n=1 Tax=Neodiprion fabricii TaxID=2872261 RepID=UPI001ED8DB92|nr:uncharacterized protein LOC124179783 [Neodiprion fabricii]